MFLTGWLRICEWFACMDKVIHGRITAVVDELVDELIDGNRGLTEHILFVLNITLLLWFLAAVVILSPDCLIIGCFCGRLLTAHLSCAVQVMTGRKKTNCLNQVCTNNSLSGAKKKAVKWRDTGQNETSSVLVFYYNTKWCHIVK